jgi:hypothetical protein
VQAELFEKQPKAVLSAIKIEAEKVERFADLYSREAKITC